MDSAYITIWAQYYIINLWTTEPEKLFLAPFYFPKVMHFRASGNRETTRLPMDFYLLRTTTGASPPSSIWKSTLPFVFCSVLSLWYVQPILYYFDRFGRGWDTGQGWPKFWHWPTWKYPGTNAKFRPELAQNLVFQPKFWIFDLFFDLLAMATGAGTRDNQPISAMATPRGTRDGRIDRNSTVLHISLHTVQGILRLAWRTRCQERKLA